VHVIDLILYIIAALCFLAAAFNATARINLIAAGVLFWVLVPALVLAQSMAGH
jgi:hypothetical protein